MAFTNPVDQGTLNRLLTNIVVPNFPQLNCAAQFQGKRAIAISFENAATTQIPTQTGVVQSPEPYRLVRLSVNLLKTQGLCQQYLLQEQISTLLGPITLYLDSATLPPFNLTNCSLLGVDDLTGAGADADYQAKISGVLTINASLYQ